MTAVERPVNEKDVAAHERKAHYSAEHLAVAAARLIALSHGDPDVMGVYRCRVCSDWCLTGDKVARELRPHRPSRAQRAQQLSRAATSAAAMAALTGEGFQYRSS